mmetsp:Transcript_134478/g.429551  ORF Transcript_134478/g.429551 Transcript_134478/m.429551 type:complete len:105 (+) Transcript_134478:346-660(+)
MEVGQKCLQCGVEVPEDAAGSLGGGVCDPAKHSRSAGTSMPRKNAWRSSSLTRVPRSSAGAFSRDRGHHGEEDLGRCVECQEIQGGETHERELKTAEMDEMRGV